ncbi:exonuclease domain-containing protein, partial [Rathayibacter iranicus]
DEDRIVTAFVGLMHRDGQVLKKKSWLIRPGIPIPEQATAVHGVTTTHTDEHGQDPAVAVADIARVLRDLAGAGVPLVAYNGRFDFTLLHRECLRHRISPLEADDIIVFDPYVIDKQLSPYRRGKRTLTATAEHLGVTLNGAHDAEADATATGGVLWKLLTQLQKQSTAAKLYTDQKIWALAQAVSLEAYLRLKEPSVVVEGAWPIVPAPVVQ